MFGSIGLLELLVIFVFALVIFGPRRLPDLGKSLGEAIKVFKRSLTDAEKPSVQTADRKEGPARA